MSRDVGVEVVQAVHGGDHQHPVLGRKDEDKNDGEKRFGGRESDLR